MTHVKPGLNQYLEVELVGIEPYLDSLSEIEVAFSQYKEFGASDLPIKIETWTSDGSSGQCELNDNVLLIPWTREDGELFQYDHRFYMDIRPVLANGQDLRVDPVELCMSYTLFKTASDIGDIGDISITPGPGGGLQPVPGDTSSVGGGDSRD